MRPISDKTRSALLLDPRMDVCARKDEGNCAGKLTWEHAIIYAGKQLDEPWAILAICEWHHSVNKYQDGGDLNKEKHEWLALKQAPAGRLVELSKAIDYTHRLAWLNSIYEKG